MRNRFDKELNELNNKLIEMGEAIKFAIEGSIEALIYNNKSLAKAIIIDDDKINRMERDIEDLSLKLLLRQQPVASDLRLISSGLKMITDMERIGDQAVDIAEISLNLNKDFTINKLKHIPKMAQITSSMVEDSLKAYSSGDLDLADRVISRDDQVDSSFLDARNELIDLIHKNPDMGEEALDLLMVSKYLERIGDHAENIAEWVIFSITGESPSI